MADKMRWRYGDTNPVVAAVDVGTAIEIGDLVWQDTNDAKPASDLTFDDALGVIQDDFKDVFLGVAMQRKRATTDPAGTIRVATSGVFEFDCASATFELGDLVGVDDTAAGTALEDQKVIAVTDAARAIGRVAARVATAATTVLVDIRSAVMTGGVQANSASAA